MRVCVVCCVVQVKMTVQTVEKRGARTDTSMLQNIEYDVNMAVYLLIYWGVREFYHPQGHDYFSGSFIGRQYFDAFDTRL
jgi:hypothetical protein